MPYQSKEALEKVKEGKELSLFKKRGSANPKANRTKSTAESTKSKRAPTKDRKTLSEILPKGKGSQNPRGRSSKKTESNQKKENQVDALTKKLKEKEKEKRRKSAKADYEKGMKARKERDAKRKSEKKSEKKPEKKVTVSVRTNVDDAVKSAASTLKKDKPKKRKKLFKKFRPFGGKIAKALLGKDEAFGGDKGAIDFVRPKKKAGGGHVKSKVAGYKDGGMAKKQGYNDRLDESLGERDGKESTKSQSYKSRRNESRGSTKKKSMGAATRGGGAIIR